MAERSAVRAQGSATLDPAMAKMLGQIGGVGPRSVLATPTGPTSGTMSAAALNDALDVSRPEVERAAEFTVGTGLAFDPTFAPLPMRVAAWAIDVVALAVLTAPGLYLVRAIDNPLRWFGVVLAMVGFVVAARSYGRAIATTGAWFGNRLTETLVVDARDGAALTSAAATTRFVLRFTISMVALGGYVVGLRGRQRRTFHDLFAGSVVIGKPPQSWTVGAEIQSGGN